MIPTSPRMRLRALVGLMSFAASAVACSDDGSATTPTPVGTVEAVIPVGSRPLPLAGGFGAIWIRNGDGDVVRVDSVTNDVVATIEVGGGPYGYITTGEGSVWVARFDNDDVARIDPLTDSVVAEISVGSAPEGVAVTPGAVWVANHHDGTISRIDPATNSVVSTIRVGPEGANGPYFMAADSDGGWVSVPNSDSSVFRIDPVTNAILARFRNCHEGIAVGAGATWLACATGLNRVDPATSKILARIDVGPVDKVAVGAGSVWIRGGETLTRVDPHTNRVIGSLEVGGTGELTFFADALWYGDETKGLVRIRPSS